jgi:hypothetical protein
MPPTKVELDHRHESLDRVINFGHREQSLRMCHETRCSQQMPSSPFLRSFMACRLKTHFVILSSILRGSNMNVGSTTRLRSAPGRSCDMMCERTTIVHKLVCGFLSRI